LASSELPSGTVTFVFTDIEGSTALLKRLGRDGYERVLSEQAGVVRTAVDAHGGQVVDTQGDSFFAAFRAARDAVAAAADIQRELAGHEWPEGVEVKVRMGLHSGEPKASGERYVGNRQVTLRRPGMSTPSDDYPADPPGPRLTPSASDSINTAGHVTDTPSQPSTQPRRGLTG
jgi:hypothetical protein